MIHEVLTFYNTLSLVRCNETKSTLNINIADIAKCASREKKPHVKKLHVKSRKIAELMLRASRAFT